MLYLSWWLYLLFKKHLHMSSPYGYGRPSSSQGQGQPWYSDPSQFVITLSIKCVVNVHCTFVAWLKIHPKTCKFLLLHILLDVVSRIGKHFLLLMWQFQICTLDHFNKDSQDMQYCCLLSLLPFIVHDFFPCCWFSYWSFPTTVDLGNQLEAAMQKLVPINQVLIPGKLIP